MKIGRCLLIASQIILLTNCAKGKDLPRRKDGYTCNISYIKDDNVVKVVDSKPVAPIGKELSISFNIAYVCNPNTNWVYPYVQEKYYELDNPIEEHYIPLNGIHVFIGDKEYKDSYNFYYINNTVNELVIKKEYMVNDVTIKIDTKKRVAVDPDEHPEIHDRLALYGIEFIETLGKRIKSDVKATFATPYQNAKKKIKLLGDKTILNSVYEDDSIDLKLEATTGSEPLPEIVFRTGAHFAAKGVDYTTEYSDDRMKCTIRVPNYVIRDHLAFAKEGDM